MAKTAVKTPENRLTPEEIAYRRVGNSPESRTWNRHFEMLIREYESALDDQDEGLIGTAVHEVRKVLGNAVTDKCGLRTQAQRAITFQRQRHRTTR